MSLSIIVAKTPDNAIGVENELPWDLPKDLSYFASITKGKTIVMGRKTFESIKKKLGGPLPGRRNVVLSSDPRMSQEGFEFINNFAMVPAIPVFIWLVLNDGFTFIDGWLWLLFVCRFKPGYYLNDATTLVKVRSSSVVFLIEQG